MTSTEIKALFAETLIGDYESDAVWDAVGKLRLDGNRETFERAAAWIPSDDPRKRALAAAILCQLMRARVPSPQEEFPMPVWLFRPESSLLIVKMLETEQDTVVLAAAIPALAHLDDESSLPMILSYRDHSDKDVRYAVATSLGCFPDHPESVPGLLKLTSDVDADVRDWAVFGLGVQGDADSPEIREVLLRCLDDPNEDVREEAAVGLGKRQDGRLLPKLLEMLDGPGFHRRVNEAAAAMLGFADEPPEWQASDYREA